MKMNRADEIKAKEIAEKHNITLEEVKKVIESPYSFIRKKTKEISLQKNLSEEEFNSMKTNFNIPCLCKLYASYKIYSYWNKIDNEKK
tara:strand:- start:1336 stop:1599 length:264 start_codon:yes stop_codon:yes gene_type:complete